MVAEQVERVVPRALTIALAVALLLLGVQSARWVFAATIVGVDPERAYALDPYNARIAGNWGLKQQSGNAPDSRKRARQIALAAFNADPTEVSSLVILGLDAQLAGHVEQARRLFGLSERLSRRDLVTQLWFIEDEVSKDNILGALRHYDIALRTKRDASGILFPVLASAASDSTVRSAIVRMLAAEPIWTQDFLIYAAQSAPDVGAAARLIVAAERGKVAISDGVRAIIGDRLIRKNDFAAAWSVYTAEGARPSEQLVRDPEFRRPLSLPSAFDWRLANEVGISTSVADGGGLEFSVAGGSGGRIARQLLMLPKGRYVFTSVGKVEVSQDREPYWTMTCAQGSMLFRAAIGGQGNDSFVVGPNCQAQWLDLHSPTNDNAVELTGNVTSISVTPDRTQ